MRQVPNDIVSTLIRTIPVLIENIDIKNKSTRVENSIRITNKIVKRLKKIENEQQKSTGSEP